MGTRLPATVAARLRAAFPLSRIFNKLTPVNLQNCETRLFATYPACFEHVNAR
jgi:hypothetical protein